MKRIIQSFLLLCITLPTFAQETPFLNDDEIRMLINELSGDRSFEHIRILTQWHRTSGMDGYFEAADYVVEEAKKAGLVDVKFIEQPLGGPNYTAKSAELWITEPIEIKLADIGDHALMLSDGSHDADVTAELVWAGTGSKEDLEGNGVDIYEGSMITVLGTSLQNKDILKFFHNSTWKIIGLEMEGAHYQKAIQAASRVRGSIQKNVKVRYAYYASDNPLETGATLASGGLGTSGVKPTYLITQTILKQILN